MIKENVSDFILGYEYACRNYERLLRPNTANELLELARVLSQDNGVNAELARGMAAYCEEMARKKQEKE